MSSLVEVLDSAETILNTWGELPIAFDNVKFDPATNNRWVRLTVVDGDSFKESIGCDRIKRTGIVTVQIFTETGIGSRIARTYADTITNLYKNITSGNVIYRTPSATRIGYENGVFQINVNIPFEVVE